MNDYKVLVGGDIDGVMRAVDEVVSLSQADAEQLVADGRIELVGETAAEPETPAEVPAEAPAPETPADAPAEVPADGTADVANAPGGDNANAPAQA